MQTIETESPAMLPVTNKRYALKFKNEYDQIDVLEGILIHPDLNGFVVFNVNGQCVLLPKDRALLLRELDMSVPASKDTTKQELNADAKEEKVPQAEPGTAA